MSGYDVEAGKRDKYLYHTLRSPVTRQSLWPITLIMALSRCVTCETLIARFDLHWSMRWKSLRLMRSGR